MVDNCDGGDEMSHREGLNDGVVCAPHDAGWGRWRRAIGALGGHPRPRWNEDRITRQAANAAAARGNWLLYPATDYHQYRQTHRIAGLAGFGQRRAPDVDVDSGLLKAIFSKVVTRMLSVTQAG